MVDEAASPDREPVQTTGKRRTRAPWVAIGLGLGLGVALGAWFHFLEGKIPTGFMSPTVSAIVVGVGVLGLLLVSATVLSISKRTRSLSRGALTTAVALVVGLPLGYVVGPTSQLPRDLAGELRVEITGASPATYSGSATCRTVENGDTIMDVIAPGIGTVGGLPLSATFYWLDNEINDAAINLALAGGTDISGVVEVQEVGTNRWTGRASFKGLVADDLDPDPDGGWSTAAGTVTWACG